MKEYIKRNPKVLDMSDRELIIALGCKWRRMPKDDKWLAVALALDALLQERHGIVSVYDWPRIRTKLSGPTIRAALKGKTIR